MEFVRCVGSQVAAERIVNKFIEGQHGTRGVRRDHTALRRDSAMCRGCERTKMNFAYAIGVGGPVRQGHSKNSLDVGMDAVISPRSYEFITFSPGL